MKVTKKLLALALAVIMMISVIPMTAFADSVTVTTYEELVAAIDEFEDGGFNRIISISGAIQLQSQLVVDTANRKTLTLNGGTLTLAPNTNGALNIKQGYVTLSGGIRINGSSSGNVLIRIYGSDDPTASSYSKLTVSNATLLDANGYVIAVLASSSNHAYGAEVICDDENNSISGYYGALYVNGKIKDTSGNVPTIDVSAGTYSHFNNTVVSLYAAGYANYNISGGIFTGGSAIYAKSGILNISGGTFNGIGEAYDYEFTENGCYYTGEAVTFEQSGKYAPIHPTVSGGVFKSKNTRAIGAYAATDSDKAPAAFVSGGTFIGKTVPTILPDSYLVDDAFERPNGTVELIDENALPSENEFGTFTTTLDGTSMVAAHTSATVITLPKLTLDWSRANAENGHDTDGWWLDGVDITAPSAEISALENASFLDGGQGENHSFFECKASGEAVPAFMHLPLNIDEDVINEAVAAGKQYAYISSKDFDWDGDGIYEQHFCVRVKVSDVVLKIDDEVYYDSMNAVNGHVAQIGNVHYTSLAQALAAAKDGETVKLLINTKGNGIQITANTFPTEGITVDFNRHTYNVTGSLFGTNSNNNFQLHKDNNITFKNGKISSAKGAMLIQNYSNLTLDNMVLDYSTERTDSYTLSNNNGVIVIKDTVINAANNKSIAFDVCRFNDYPSVLVTVTGASEIHGTVELTASNSDAKDGITLVIEGGTFYGKLNVKGSASAAIAASENSGIFISGGKFSEDVTEYLVPGAVFDPETGEVTLHQQKSINVRVTDENGSELKAGYTVNWYEKGSDRVVAEGNSFSVNTDDTKQYQFRVILSEELGYLYQQPARQDAVTEGEDADFQVQLEALKSIAVSGTIADVAGKAIGNASLLVKQTFADRFVTQKTITTDANGAFSLSIKNVPTKIVIEADGYYTRTHTVVTDAAQAALDLGSIELTALPQNKITLTMSMVQAAEEGQKPVSIPLHSANAIDFELFNRTRNKKITAFTVQYPYIILDNETASPNDSIVIEATDQNTQAAPAKATVVLDSQAMAACELQFVDNGKFTLGELGGSTPCTLMVFDHSGKLINSTVVTSAYESEALPAGDYSLVFIKSTDFLGSVSRIDKLEELGLSQAKDYIVKNVTIAQGIISDIGAVTVPALDESKLNYTDPENTSIAASVSSAPAGKYVVIKCAYKIDKKYASDNEVVTFELSEGLEFTKSSLTVDGKIHSYTISNNTVKVVTGQREGVIRFYVVASNAGKKQINAFLAFKNDGAALLQSIGTANFTAESGIIILPKKTRQDVISVRGSNMANSTVTLYDNGIEVGKTATNANGSWQAKISLVSPYSYSYHTIYAKIENEKLLRPVFSEEKLLIHDKNYIEVSKVEMINIAYGHIQQTTVFDFLNPSNKVPSYDYYSGYPTFTFKVKFTEKSDTVLSNVCVVSTNQAGTQTTIPCTYDKTSDLWIGSYNFKTFSSVPVSVNVSFSSVSEESMMIDAKRFTDVEDILADVDREMEQELKKIEENFSYEVDTSLSLDESYQLILSQYDAIESAVESAVDYADGVFTQNLKGRGIALENAGESGAEISVEDAFQSELSFSDCKHLTEQELLESGFEAINVSDGSKLYVKNETGKYAVADFARDLYMEVDCEDEGAKANRSGTPVTRAGGFDAQAILAVFDKVVSVIQTIYDCCDIINGSFDKMLNTLNHNLEYCKGLQMNSVNQQVRFYNEIQRMKANGAPTQDIKYYQECLDNIAKKEESIRKSIDKITGKINKIKALGRIMKGLNLFSLITSIMELKDQVARLTELYISVPDPCENDSARANAIRRDIILLGAAVSTYVGLNIYLSLVGITGSLIGTPATGGLALAGVVAVTSALIASMFFFESSMNNNCRLIEGRIRELKCNKKKDPSNPERSPSLSARPICDPSGYVYEAVPSNRVEGVKAEAYYYDYALDEFGIPADTKSDILWDAEEYDQVNPLYTDANGMYAWDVPLGQWLVKYSKEGYYDTDSRLDAATDEDGYLPVPPPQTQVNVGIVSKSLPTVSEVNIFNSEVRIVFSQYMQLDSVNTNNITVSMNGRAVSGTITPINAEYDYEHVHRYASKFAFVPSTMLDGEATVTIKNAKNYAGKVMATTEIMTGTVLVKPEGITAQDAIDITFGSGALLSVDVSPAKAGAGMTVTAQSVAPSIVEVVNPNAVIDENGHANIMLSGVLPGESEIIVTLDGTEYTATVRATVGNVVVESDRCEKVTANIASGTAVKAGTTVELSTQTQGAEIYYTLDGTCPCTIDSPSRIKYTEPIVIQKDTFLIAYAVKDGMKESYTAGFNYFVKSEHVHDYTQKVVKPTATQVGYTLYTCRCGDSYQSNYTAPTGKLTLKHSARTANAIKVQWNKVKTATGYQVQISTKNGKKWSTYANLKAGVTSYTFKKLAAGNNYKFRVRFYIKGADGKNYYSPWSATLNSPTLPTGTTLTKLTPAKKAFTAQWKKAGFTGYQIQYGLKSNFKGAKTLTVKNAKTLKATMKSLSAKKTYYVRIRTYKTIAKANYFSTWSKTYKVKTK